MHRRSIYWVYLFITPDRRIVHYISVNSAVNGAVLDLLFWYPYIDFWQENKRRYFILIKNLYSLQYPYGFLPCQKERSNEGRNPCMSYSPTGLHRSAPQQQRLPLLYTAVTCTICNSTKFYFEGSSVLTTALIAVTVIFCDLRIEKDIFTHN